jgi:hypothetical protein
VQLAYFVHEVRRLKAALKAGESNGPLLPEPRFRPELARARRPARRIGPIEAQCDRGLVLSALHDALAAEGLRVQAGGTTDLATLDRSRVRHIFSVHADSAPNGLVAAVGRLFLAGAGLKPPPTRILVHPGNTPSEITAAGVQVLRYTWAAGRPVFDRGWPDLD